jgi:hypothetical protein
MKQGRFSEEQIVAVLKEAEAGTKVTELCRRHGPGERVARVLERLREMRGLPAVIQADNGPELRGQVLDQWAYDHGVQLRFIEPGKPIQNAFIESFNARLREECLNQRVLSHSTMHAAKSNNGGLNTFRNARVPAWTTCPPKSLRRWPGSQGARPSRAPLDRRKKGWFQRRTTLRPRIQNPGNFSATLKTARRVAGKTEIGTTEHESKNESKPRATTNLRMGYQLG